MNFAILLAALASTASSSSEVCQKLSADFASNEQSYAFWYDINSTILDNEIKHRAAIAPAERALAIERARAGYPPLANASSEKIRKARATLEETDAKYKAEGDRITTLLIANKCTPPDHVTSWTTYAKKKTEAAK